jgi:hypothetical protein
MEKPLVASGDEDGYLLNPRELPSLRPGAGSSDSGIFDGTSNSFASGDDYDDDDAALSPNLLGYAGSGSSAAAASSSPEVEVPSSSGYFGDGSAAGNTRLLFSPSVNDLPFRSGTFSRISRYCSSR